MPVSGRARPHRVKFAMWQPGVSFVPGREAKGDGQPGEPEGLREGEEGEGKLRGSRG